MLFTTIVVLSLYISVYMVLCALVSFSMVLHVYVDFYTVLHVFVIALFHVRSCISFLGGLRGL